MLPEELSDIIGIVFEDIQIVQQRLEYEKISHSRWRVGALHLC